MKKLIIGVVVVTVLAGGAYAAMRSARGSAEEAAKKDAPVASPVKADKTVVADARVVPVRSASLAFATGGVVAKVLVREGERVQAGQVLVRLDSLRQAAAVAQAEAQLLRAQARLEELQAGPRPAEVASAQAGLEAARVRLARAKAGSPPLEVAIAEADVRSAQAQLDLVTAGARKETIAAAKADVAAAKASLAQAKAALAETELRAPFAGTVASLELNPGEYVGPGTPVLKLADLTSWQLETEDLTELAVNQVREGDKATVTFDAIANLKLPARVTRINPLGENKSGDITYRVTLAPERQDARLRWNMTASVAIEPR